MTSIDAYLAATLTRTATVEASEAARHLTDYLVIDVREPAEVLHGYLPGAINIPRGVLEFRVAGADGLASGDRPMLLYSDTGVRSALATEALRTLGVHKVRSLGGGLACWVEHGLPLA